MSNKAPQSLKFPSGNTQLNFQSESLMFCKQLIQHIQAIYMARNTQVSSGY